ncbi:MmgE/PrpD family protein [Bordetella hinzii 5132]|uniref:MmgE/PrpD family protein n=2 Tax=Bordetella hinzii TaxID=103855 RepID=A0ABR4R6M7_9BORD|nr:MmgE/PrpD family protein [Bordetella hinzii OH87 BAL007II]KCB41049.1 MmgE/PrpD family protein [Bordetella hinzii 5132]KCB47972.1 MmgE/PrpD family protein [Bordetella hinzii 4161]KCB52961.1 MmgE/PrpD family protein [Bordetella hinzii 1277]KXA74395.1 2-methylcitrate dehydratase [Bordetella hinzii LMG 13501]QDJ35675.1 MmgE/PrpD family protein [Bordetella hinzii]
MGHRCEPRRRQSGLIAMPNPHSRPNRTPLISTQLARHAVHSDIDAIPPAVRQRATHLMLDALGIALASTQWDFARQTLAGLRELAGPGGDQPVIGHGQNLPMRDAVIMNALLIHGLDYDDTHPSGVIHATTSVLPAVLGLSTRLNASGRDLLNAYVLGVETATRLGAAAKGGFHQVGFHPTGLIGAFGCTLAAARLLRLDVDRAIDAQGITLSVASGSLECLEDGAWTKRLHPGWGAAAGITAATLAKHGFVGPGAAYEGRFGLYPSHLGAFYEKCDLDMITAGLGEEWETLNVAIKPLPACHFTHAFADAAGILSKEWRGAPIRRIVAKVPPGAMKAVCEPAEKKQRPSNAYEAQFSVPYSVATGLRFGRYTLDALDPAAWQDPETLRLASLVECLPDPDADFPRYFGGQVHIELADGRVLSHTEPINRGAPDRPITNDEIVVKFHENAARAVSRAHADHVLNAVLGIERGSAAELSQLLGVQAHMEKTQ